MSLEPYNWSVAIVGYWNTAILTPARISTEIFKNPQGHVIEVGIPVDGIIPHRVKDPAKNIIVEPDRNRLEIKLGATNYDILQHALTAGIEALKWLPKTPVSAAGYNVNFRTEESSDEIINLFQNPTTDSLLSGLKMEINSQSLTRSFVCDAGLLNLTASGKKECYELHCNFHRSSNDPEDLIAWLSIPVADINTKVNHIFTELKLGPQEVK